MTKAELREKFSMAMDGTVIAVPPSDETERMNFCMSSEEFMWRKPTESFKGSLGGDDPYVKQLPLSRAIPLWGGISEGGFAVVAFHTAKKLKSDEWAKLVGAGKLSDAVTKLRPVHARGPWHVLCDNEGFLTAKPSTQAYKKCRVKLWKIPSKSPDLNPIERFWSHLKRHLRKMDLADAARHRPALDKPAYRKRVRRVLGTNKMQNMATKCAGSLKKVCKVVLEKKGRATGL